MNGGTYFWLLNFKKDANKFIIYTGANGSYVSAVVPTQGPTVVGGVNCTTGTEERLSNCIITKWGMQSCARYAGVSCRGKVFQGINENTLELIEIPWELMGIPGN